MIPSSSKRGCHLADGHMAVCEVAGQLTHFLSKRTTGRAGFIETRLVTRRGHNVIAGLTAQGQYNTRTVVCQPSDCHIAYCEHAMSAAPPSDGEGGTVLHWLDNGPTAQAAVRSWFPTGGRASSIVRRRARVTWLKTRTSDEAYNSTRDPR